MRGGASTLLAGRRLESTLPVERRHADAKPPGGLALVAPRLGQRLPDVPALELADGLAKVERRKGLRLGGRPEGFEVNDIRLPEHHGLFQDVFELPDVAVPG